MSFVKKCLILLLFLICLSPSIDVHAATKYLMIGDSRFVGMKSAVGTHDGVDWTCAVSAANSHFLSGGYENSGTLYDYDKVIKKWSDKNTIVIYELGVNGLNSSQGVEALKKLTSYYNTVYFCEVGPKPKMNSGKKDQYTSTTDKKIDKYNKAIKAGKTGALVIECNDYLKKLPAKSDDGIHYVSSTYKKWYKKIMSQVKGGSSSDGDSDSGGGLSEEERQAILDKINKDMNRSAKLDVLTSVCKALKASGFNDYACAAILVNMNRESSITPNAGQSGGGGAIGLIQWDGGRRDNLQSYSKKVNDTKYTVKGYQIGGLGTQTAFLMVECKGSDGFAKQWGGVAPVPKYSKLNQSECEKAINDSKIDITKTTSSFEEWSKLNNVVAMSVYFTSQMERCAYGIDIFNEGAKQSPDMYKLVTGTGSSSKDNKDVNKEIAKACIQTGFWSEEELSNFNYLLEEKIDLSGATLDSLGQMDTESVSSWKSNIKDMNEKDTLFYKMRIIFIGFGILISIWGMLLYLGYWFDRLNQFIPIRFLDILSFKKLSASYDDSSTYKSDASSGSKLVSHRDMIKIVIFMETVGVAIASGFAFNLILKVIGLVTSLIFK